MMPLPPSGARSGVKHADDVTHRSRVVVTGAGRRVDEDKIIEIRKTVGGGNEGYHRGTNTHDYIVWTKGQGEGSDGGRRRRRRI